VAVRQPECGRAAVVLGFYAPSNYLIVLLEVFAILLFACAVAAEYVGTIFGRLNAHIIMARTEASGARRLGRAD